MSDLIHPTRDWYIIKRFEDAAVTEGGITIPDQAIKKTPFGRVLAKGPGKPCDFAFQPAYVDDDGCWKGGEFPVLPMSAEQGDVVFFSEHGARELEVEGLGKIYAVNEVDIIGVVEQGADAKVEALKEAGLL